MRLHSVLLAVTIIAIIPWVNCKTKKVKNKKCDKEKCSHKSAGKESIHYLGSKRPYCYNKDYDEYQYTPQGCKAVKFWYFGRHGTRNPGESDILKMQTLLPKLQEEVIKNHKECRGELCKKDLKGLKSWNLRSDLTIFEASYLVKEGKREIMSIGSRYQKRFPNLFPPTFDNNTYYFKSTKSERTQESARSFAKAIFGNEELKNVWFPEPQKADPVLKFYQACPKWKKEVDENPEANLEHAKFTRSSIMNKTISRISETLGLSRQLTVEEVVTMYTTCGFETAWKKGKISPWCKLFDLEAMEVMSYREDLDYYWLDGYGYETNYKQACPALRDAVEYFQKHIEDPSSPKERKVQAYFSHSGGTLKILARLGLFRDPVPLKSDNFEEVKNNYKWRTSIIDTMATNMAFVLYDCPSEPSRYQIGYFFQEIPTPLKACDGEWICPFENFEREMTDIVDDCDIREICGVSP